MNSRSRQSERKTKAARSAAVETSRLVFRPVDRQTWPDFAALFEERGGPKSCWCMVWRATPGEAKARDGASRRAQIEARVEAGAPIGLLAYCEAKPIAWCSIAPRETYRPLGGPPAAPDEKIWSIVCFFIKRSWRGQGLAASLIEAAAAEAAKRGATTIEAYPVDPNSPSYRFMGFVPLFEAAGFREVGQAGARRRVMRRAAARS